MKVLGTFPIGTLEKYLNKKMKVLGNFSMGMQKKYLKIEKLKFQVLFQWERWKSPLKWKIESFRYFSNGYVGKVPKKGKMKV